MRIFKKWFIKFSYKAKELIYSKNEQLVYSEKD